MALVRENVSKLFIELSVILLAPCLHGVFIHWKSMIGNKYGKWTVIGDIIRNERKQAFLECKCDCGTIQKVLQSNLKHGRSHQCLKCAKAKSVAAFTGRIYRSRIGDA